MEILVTGIIAVYVVNSTIDFYAKKCPLEEGALWHYGWLLLLCIWMASLFLVAFGVCAVILEFLK